MKTPFSLLIWAVTLWPKLRHTMSNVRHSPSPIHTLCFFSKKFLLGKTELCKMQPN